MKKLIALIGAAVMSFGLFAALDPSVEFQTHRYTVPDFDVGPTNIVGYDDVSVKNVFTGGTVYWFADNFPTGDVGLVDYEQPAEVAEDGDAKVLKIEADTAYPMLRTFGPVQRTATSEGASYSKPTFDIGTLGLFADSKIKLSASEEAPQDFTGKIAVWLQVIPEDTTAEPATPGSTNLMVTCGQLDGEFSLADTPTNIAIAADGVTVKPEEWHQITIRSIKEIKTGETIPGFVIYVDGKLAQAAQGAYVLPSGLTETAQKFATDRALFASASSDADTAQTLESVGFAGNGSLSYIDLTDAYNAPDFAQDPTEVLITWDEHVDSITIGGTDITQLEGVSNYSIMYQVTGFANKSASVEAEVVYKTNYRGKSITDTSVTPTPLVSFAAEADKSAFSFSIGQFAQNGAVTVVSELDRDEALVTVDGEVKPMYSSLAQAFADINTLYKNANNIKIEIGESVVTLSDKKYLNSYKGKLVIDLKGNTIQFTYEPADGEEAYGIVNNSTLTIQDTSDNGGGKIEAVNGIPLIYNILATTIAKATGANDIVIDGSVLNENVYFENEWFPGEITVLGGKFSEKVVCFCTADGELPEGWEDHVEDGITLGTQAIPLKWSDARDEDGYWTLEFAGANLVVKDNEGVTFTFKTNDVLVAEGVKVVPLSSGMTAEIVATLKEHYEFADVEAAKAAGWTFTSEDTVATTNIAAIVEVGTGITVTIPATEAIEYTITTTGGENAQVALDPEDGKVAYGEEVEITAIPDEHYTYEGVELPAGWGTNEFGSATNTVTVTGDAEIAVPNATAIVVTSVTLDQTSLEVVEGAEPVKLVATVEPADALVTTVTWESDNTAVATVAADGTVTFGAVGEATITAKVGAVSDTCTVTVTAAGPTVYFPQADIEEQYKDRNGTEALPFVIRKYDDLVALQNMVADGQTTAGVYFEQVADIDFDGKDPWAGIGQAKKKPRFCGTYDGAGKKVTNITLDGNVEYAALFGQIGDGAVVKNISEVNIAGVANYKDDACVGGLVGYAEGTVTVSDIKVTGTIGTTEQPMKDNVSGLICRADNKATKDSGSPSVFTRLEFAGTINAASASLNRKVAGILGYAVGKVVLDQCVCSGTLVDNASVDFTYKDGPQGGVGGLVSYIWSDALGLTFKDCVMKGTIVANQNVMPGAGLYGASIGVTITFEGTNKIAKASFDGDVKKFNGNSNSWPKSYAVENAEDASLLDMVDALKADETFYTIKTGLTPTYQFTDVGTIAFNTNLFEAAAFNVTGDESLEVTETAAEGVVTFTAAIKTFDVTFKPENGSADIVSNDVAYGTAFADVAPNDLKKTGYDFAGWDPIVGTIDGTVLEFTAQWTAIQYTLTLTGGENVTTNVNPEKATYTYGDAVAITATAKENFTFTGVELGEGWGLNDDGAATNTVTITGNTSVAIPNAKAAQTEPIPVPPSDDKVAETLEEAGITDAPDITTVDDVKALNAILKVNNITDAKTGLTADQKAHINDTFLMSQNGITPNHIYSEAAQIKIDKIEATETSGKWAFEVTIADGTTPVAAAEIAAKALAGSAKKATTLGTWATIEAADIETAATPGTAGKVTFTVNYGNGQQGFLKIDVSKVAK